MLREALMCDEMMIYKCVGHDALLTLYFKSDLSWFCSRGAANDTNMQANRRNLYARHIELHKIKQKIVNGFKKQT
jgi:hypothetical protein